jgi:hypothetical protein
MSHTILEYVVARTCERYEHNGDEFTTANFQTERSRVTDSRPMVTSAVAELVLMSVPGVKRGDGRCHWTYRR